MTAEILCVGSLKERYWRDAVAEYTKRLSGYCRTQIREVPDERTPEGGMSDRERSAVLAREGDRLRRLMGESRTGTRRIALCIGGRRYSSEEWATHLSSLMGSGTSHLQFVIGGSLGLDEALVRETDEQMSFSDFTFPHQMMRVILLEQLYRAFRIIRGEPYHK